MSPRASRRVLLLAALLLLPLPLIGFGAFAPVARYLLLGGVCIGMWVAEGPGGVIWELTGLFLGHAVVYTLLLWGLCFPLARALGALPARARGASVALLVVAATLWALTTQPYVTPFGTAARGGLLEVLR